MKKIIILPILFIFALSLNACSTQNTPIQDTASEEGQETTSEMVNQEEIKAKLSATQIDNISANEEISSPISITGTTDAQKNQLFIELRDSEHNSKVRGYAIVSENDNTPNTFKITLNFLFNSTKEGYIAAYELDDNGQEKNLVEIPVRFKTE